MAIQTITLNAAEKAFIPKTAKILSVDSTGGISLNPSNCVDTTPLPSICMSFKAIAEDAGDGEFDALCGLMLKSIDVGDTIKYDIDEKIMSDNCSSFNIDSNQINNKNIPGIKCVGTSASLGSNSRTEFEYILKVPSDYKTKMILFFTSRYLPTGFYIKGSEVDCPDPIV